MPSHESELLWLTIVTLVIFLGLLAIPCFLDTTKLDEQALREILWGIEGVGRRVREQVEEREIRESEDLAILRLSLTSVTGG